MGRYGEELERVSASGKTFFLNRHEASNGNPYLRLDTLSGNAKNPKREKMALFEAQWKPLRNALDRAATAMGWQPVAAATAAAVCFVCKEEIDEWTFARREEEGFRCEACFDDVPYFMRQS